jgi:4-amino-4-deoxy-L-arabinose transferase-like glycosyltransferase
MILALLACALFLYNQGGWDLWNPDEPRYALVAKEMAEGGNWILPHLNHKIYPDKPPVFFWLIALCYKVLGTNAFAARLPSALAAIAGVMITYLLGFNLYSARAGFVSALILSTMVEYFWLGRRANIDMTLTVFILSAFLFFYQWYRKQASKRRAFSLYLFYFFMGAATLTKGPVGFLLPVLTIVFYLFAKKDLIALKRVFFHPGVLLFFAVVLAWIVPACIQGGEAYRNNILFKQTIGRVHDSWSHKEPFYYYFLTLPILLYPWFFFLPSTFIYLFTRREKIGDDFLFPIIWFITIFAFFTLCSGKRELYLLPLFPAGALMTGFLFDCFFGKDPLFESRLITFPSYLLAGSLIAACPALPFVVQKLSDEYRQTLQFYPLLIIVGLNSTLALYFLLKQKSTITFTLIIIIMSGCFLATAGLILPSMNQFKSAKPFSLRIKSYMREGDYLVSYRLHSEIPAFDFYTVVREIKQFETADELVSFFNQSDTRIFCLMQKQYFSQLLPIVPISLTAWDAALIGRHDIVLISNHPPEGHGQS